MISLASLTRGAELDPRGEWDQALRDHIARIREDILGDEEAFKEYMRSEGASEETIARVAARQASKGGRISSDGATLIWDRAVKWADQIADY